MADREIGIRLKAAREHLKLTQAKVCEALGIPKPQTLSAYESGVNSPPIEALKGLSVLYQVSVDWIVFGEESPKSRQKTATDYISDLFNAIDKLGLEFICEEELGSNACWYYIQITNNKLRGFNSLIADLSKIYGVRGAIDNDDFQMLVQKKIGDHAKKSNNFEEIPPQADISPLSKLVDDVPF